jgi:hypothetical protein
VVFTGRSAVFGVFNHGDATDAVYGEDAQLPPPSSVFAAAGLAPHRAILHGVAADVSQRELAQANNPMIGTDERTDNLTLEQMLGIDIGTIGTKGASFIPPPTAASGISLSLNKRLSSENTRKLLDWSPGRTDLGEDIALGSCAH